MLAELTRTWLREANEKGDLASPVAVMEAAFYFHRVNTKMNGMQDFIHKALHGHDFWQNMRFWEKSYYGMLFRVLNFVCTCIDSHTQTM